MITWKFDELDIYFQSKTENLQRDVSKMAYANGVSQTAKITIIDGAINQFISTDSSSSDGDASTSTQSAVPVGTKKGKARKQETDGLSNLHGDVESIATATPILENGIDPEFLGGSSDSISI